MADMLVNLFDFDFSKVQKEIYRDDLKIVRALSVDKAKVLDFIGKNFEENWVNECDRAFSRGPVSCFIAIQEKKVVGFACYDATAKGFFGPTGVKKKLRGKGIGSKLLMSCLADMWDQEYGYAIIGWVDNAAPFYEKAIGAQLIEGSSPGLYKRMVEA